MVIAMWQDTMYNRWLEKVAQHLETMIPSVKSSNRFGEMCKDYEKTILEAITLIRSKKRDKQ